MEVQTDIFLENDGEVVRDGTISAIVSESMTL